MPLYYFCGSTLQIIIAFRCGVSIDVYQYIEWIPMPNASNTNLFLFTVRSIAFEGQRSIKTWFQYFRDLISLVLSPTLCHSFDPIFRLSIEFFSLQSIHFDRYVRQKAASIFEYLILINHACLIANNRKDIIPYFFPLLLLFHFSAIFSSYYSHVSNAKLSKLIDISISIPSPIEYLTSHAQFIHWIPRIM